MRLKHRRLLWHAQRLEQGQSSLRWLDLYAVQALMDQFGTASGPSEAAEEQALVDLLLACSASVLIGFTSLPLLTEPYRNCIRKMATLGLRLPDADRLASMLDMLKASKLMMDADSLAGNRSEIETGTDESNNSTEAPLVRTGTQLFLYRMWQQHTRLLRWLEKQEQASEHVDASRWLGTTSYQDLVLKNYHRLFPDSCVDPSQPGHDTDWQAVTAARALMQPLTLVSGGPGTGKTSTAARILILMQLQRLALLPEHERGACKIRLLAPTGKAAVRLQQSISAQYESLLMKLELDEAQRKVLRAAIPEQGETIHRAIIEVKRRWGHSDALNIDQFIDSDQILLGPSERPRLHADIVLVDEASMIDQKLMIDLLSILPERGLANEQGETAGSQFRMMLMGDHFQLPPVESGEVFARWCARYQDRGPASVQREALNSFYPGLLNKEDLSRAEAPGLLARLHKTYRFGGPIQILAQSLRRGSTLALEQSMPVVTAVGRSDAAEDLLSDAALVWIDIGLGAQGEQEARQLGYALENMLERYRAYFDAVRSGAGLTEIMQEKSRFQILCSTYEGPFGAHALNRLVEERFAHEGLYHGKGIMVSANQPELGLYNGDLGFLMPAGPDAGTEASDTGPAYLVCFPDKELSTGGVPLAMIRDWQTAFAISIHKSQGSEYEQVAVFAPDYARELLSRRLLYTGLTRSQRSAELWISRQALDMLDKEEQSHTEMA